MDNPKKTSEAENSVPSTPLTIEGEGGYRMREELSLSFSEFGAAMNGDHKSALRLLAMARFLCSAVEDFRVRQPTLANKIARKLPDWPALVGRHKAARSRIVPILIKLELAEDHPAKKILACDGKGKDLDGNINATALFIWEWMNRYRRPAFSNQPDSAQFRTLPEFSSDVFAQWWNMGWPYFVKSAGHDPFNYDCLAAERIRIEGVANSEGVTAFSRAATEVRKAAKKLWPQMAGLSDKIGA